MVWYGAQKFMSNLYYMLWKCDGQSEKHSTLSINSHSEDKCICVEYTTFPEKKHTYLKKIKYILITLVQSRCAYFCCARFLHGKAHRQNYYYNLEIMGIWRIPT